MNNLSLSPACSNVHTKTFLLEEHNKSMKGMSPDPSPMHSSNKIPNSTPHYFFEEATKTGSAKPSYWTAAWISQTQTKHPILVIGRSCHKYLFVATKVLSWQMCLLWQTMFVATKHVYCSDKNMLATTKFCRNKRHFLSQQTQVSLYIYLLL